MNLKHSQKPSVLLSYKKIEHLLYNTNLIDDSYVVKAITGSMSVLIIHRNVNISFFSFNIIYWTCKYLIYDMFNFVVVVHYKYSSVYYLSYIYKNTNLRSFKNSIKTFYQYSNNIDLVHSLSQSLI